MRIAAVQWREQPERTEVEALHAAIAAEYGALEAEMARTLEMTGWSKTALRARYPRIAAPA
jgi:hypothetical protein